jgi:uncharacterized membrane protein SpoIIM required for sporulation
LIFGSNPGYMIVGFITILLFPTISKLLLDEENIEIREKKFNVLHLLRDHRDIFEIYFFLFMGVFVVSLAASFFLPKTFNLFQPQLAVAGLTGYAFNPGTFASIVINNLIVFAVCFILSLVYGAGSFLFLSWNATTWGAIFGFYMKSNLALIVPVLPHLITETVAYLGAAIVGGIISKGLLREKLHSKGFYHHITDGLFFLGISVLILVVAAIIEASI